MSGIIDDLKLQSISIKESKVPMSLESLLLGSQASTLLEELEVSGNTTEVDDTSSSRKGRRKKIKSTRVVSRRPGEQQKKGSTEQKRLESKYQEKNKAALLEYQLQSKQKTQPQDNQEFVGGLNNISYQKSEIISTTKILRPVILGSIDLDPIYNIRGRYSPAGNLLRLKRSVRRIKLDKIIKPKLKDQEFKGVPLAVALVDYLNAKENFFNSLRPSNISMYEHALSAFEITLTRNVSNSEMLYTLLHEYSTSLNSGTAQLDESAPRSIDSGPELIEEKSGKMELLRTALATSSRDAYVKYAMAQGDDIEVALKSLISLFTKDIVYSFNSVNSSIVNNNPHGILRTVKRVTQFKTPENTLQIRRY